MNKIKRAAVVFTSLSILLALQTRGQSTYFQAVTNLNPVAYWPLQETALPPGADVETNLGSLGAVADAYYSSTNVYHGQSGSPADSSDASVYCNGSGGAFLAVPTADPRTAVPAGPFTVEAWINPANYNNYRAIVSQSGPNPGGLNGSTNRGGWVLSQNYYAYLDKGNLVGWSFHVYNGEGAGNGQPQGGAEAGVSFTYSTNTWYYLVGVFNGTNCTLYVDGTNVSDGYGGYQIPMTGSYVPDTWDPLCIGCGRGLNGNLFTGGIDEVAIYTNALTAAQVAAHYAAAAGTYSSTILADHPYMYWRMDAPAAASPAVSAYPVAINYGSGAGLDGLYLSGTTPGVAGPALSGMGSPSYACAFNGIGTDSTNEVGIATNGVVFDTNSLNSGVVVTNTDDALNQASNDYTVICWFKGNPMDRRLGSLLGRQGSWQLHLDGGSGEARFNPGIGSAFASPGSYNDGEWHFMAGVSAIGSNTVVTVDTNTVPPITNFVINVVATNNMYVDGLQVASSVTAVPNVTNSSLTLGAMTGFTDSGNNGWNERFLAGSLAQVAIFTNALTASQIDGLYTAAGATPVAPTITAQPYPYPSVRTVTGGPGSYIYEAVTAYGGTPDLSYSWYYNTTSNYTGASLLTDGATYSGTTTSQITITNLTDSNSGFYFCVVGNNYGATTSAIVDVQVNTKPIITAQNPSGPFTLFAGQNPVLSVTATGVPVLNYQWLTNGVADTTAGTNALYTLPADQVQSGETFQCVVTNSYGSATSVVATLTVQPLPVNITSSSYATNILALKPTAYFPMHEVAAAAPGDTETNYGSAGVLADAYYSDWNVNGGFPDSADILHQIPGALVGDPDGAVNFQNNNGYLLVPHTLPQVTLTTPFTIECWVYGMSTGFGDIISEAGTVLNGGGSAGNHNGVRISWNRGNNLEVYAGKGTTSSSAWSMATATGDAPLNQWVYVALTYDGTNYIIYVDGNQATSMTHPFYPDTWDPLTIGAGMWGGGGPARQATPMAVDDVAIYGTSLDQTTILNHYEAGIGTAGYGAYKTNVLADDPVLYYRMDAPIYSQPPTNTWPVVTNYGTVAVNGLYMPGSQPGTVSGPNNGTGSFASGFSATNASPCSGMSPIAAVGYDPSLNPTNYTPMSVALWFKGNPADPRFQNIVGHSDNSWRVDLDNHGKVHFNAGAGGEITSVGVYNDGNWHQVVGVYNGGTNYLYVDGVLDKENDSATNAIVGSTDDVILGGDPQYLNSNKGVGRQFAGDLCEVAFWNGTALTPGQVQTLYNAAAMPPSIITQPISAKVNQGMNFTNTVVANGSQPLTYQWYQNGQPLGSQTNASLVLAPAVSADAGNYYVTVSNGSGTVTSTTVALTINASPLFTSQYPAAYTNLITLFAGASPTFSVTTVGQQPITYEWFTNNVMVPGATSPDMTLTNIQIGSYSVYCVASNSVATANSMTWQLLVIAAPTAPYPVAVLADNPFGYWRLNETNGATGDTYPNDGILARDYVGGNNGIYTNADLAQPGYNTNTDLNETAALFGYNDFSNSLVFGVQHVNFSAPTNSSVAFSVEAWVNGYQQSQDAGIVSKGTGGGGEQFDLDTGANSTNVTQPLKHNFRFFVRDASGVVHGVNSFINPADGRWHHLVGVCDEPNSNVVLYVDGVAIGTNIIMPGSGILTSTNTMKIGARPGSSNPDYNNFQFVGRIDDVAVYNHALNASQVRNQYAAAGVPPNLYEPPPTSVTVNENGTLVIPAAAVGTGPMGYQWLNLSAGTNIATGLTTGNSLDATLTISNFPASLNNLQLTVSNVYGSAVANVQVIVNSGPPQFVQNLPPVVTSAAGHPYTYAVVMQGTEPFSYTWYYNGTAVAGATNSSYSFIAASGSYYVVVTNIDGSATSVVSEMTTVPLPTNAYANSVLALNPAGYWPLQETTPAAPATMETNYGTLGALGTAYYGGFTAPNTSFGQGGALTNSGDNDPSVGFVGGNQNGYLFVPLKTPALNLPDSFTWECWVNSTSTGFSDIMGNGGTDGDGSGNASGIRLSYNRSTSIQAYWYIGSGIGSYHSTGTPSGSITAGVWNYVVMTYDAQSGALNIYINGTNQDSTTATGYLPDFSTPLTIGTGRWDGGPTRSYTGLMDEVAVYTNALTQTQITAHYQAAITPGSNYVQAVESDHPLLYYRMDGTLTNVNPVLYPDAVNFGSVPVNGAYQSGVTPGGVSGPPMSGLTNSVAAPINGVYSCVDAGFAPAFNPTGTQPFTAMTWFRGYPADNRAQAIMSQSGNWAINFDGSTGSIIWNLYSGGQVTSTNVVLNDGQWHLIAGVYDGANSYLYVDGQLNNSGPAGGLAGEPNTDLFLGGDAGYTFAQYQWGARYFAGALAQASFFTNALSAAQIQAIYNTAVPPPPSISVARSGNQLIITYTGTLLSATNVAGPYAPVTGATSPYTVTPTGAQEFYRTSSQ